MWSVGDGKGVVLQAGQMGQLRMLKMLGVPGWGQLRMVKMSGVAGCCLLGW
jgi:hypothetical protein